jgi:hypothetical protein
LKLRGVKAGAGFRGLRIWIHREKIIERDLEQIRKLWKDRDRDLAAPHLKLADRLIGVA